MTTDRGIPTEPIGSIPRPAGLVDSMQAAAEGRLSDEDLSALFDDAVRDTIAELEAAGSPVVTDGEQRKPSFATYPVAGLTTLAADGVVIPFADGHTRRLPVLTEGPLRYATYAGSYVASARPYAARPLKQAVISASAISLLYPADGIDGYSRDQFIADLVDEAEADIRSCFDAGAASVQIDFTEGRLSLKLDPSGGLLRSFVDLNNAVLDRFSDDERRRIGVHTCPGGDHDSTHSADVDYSGLLPALFDHHAGSFFLELAGEGDPEAVLVGVAANVRPDQRVYVGVTDPIDPVVESPETVRDRVLLAARHLPLDRLGTTDDCGFSPFADDGSTARETAFAKIRARIEGTALAAEALGM
jgi:5-methyltetrahydropteroyltriglutamate--homocysteine methyltransferase